MLEQLLLSSAQGKYFADSGPGPKILVFGDADLGYFGELTTAEFGSSITASIAEYVKDENLTFVQDPTNIWYKFFSDGKVLYIPARPICDQVTSSALVNYGMMSGLDESVTYSTLSITKEQSARVFFQDSEKMHTLRVRAMTCVAGPRVTSSLPSKSSSTGGGGEYSSIWTPMLLNTRPINEWPRLKNTQGSSYISTITFFTCNVYTDNNFLLGYSHGISQVTTSSPSTKASWRPVLELIPDADTNPYLITPALTVIGSAPRSTAPYVGKEDILIPPEIVYPDQVVVSATPEAKTNDGNGYPAVLIAPVMNPVDTSVAATTPFQIASVETTIAPILDVLCSYPAVIASVYPDDQPPTTQVELLESTAQIATMIAQPYNTTDVDYILPVTGTFYVR